MNTGINIKRVIIQLLLAFLLMPLPYTFVHGLENQIEEHTCPCNECNYKKIHQAKILDNKKEKLITFSYQGHEFYFSDLSTSFALDIIKKEIETGSYELTKKRFTKDNNIIVDIGAHVGVVSIILAKLNPQVSIYAVEACPLNYQNFIKNIARNNVTNIHPFNFAVTDKTGESVIIHNLGAANSGASTLQPTYKHYKLFTHQEAKKSSVPTISFDDLLGICAIKECALLKIDCEGSEYSILFNSEKFKNGVVHDMAAEFHESDLLRNQGYNPHMLYDYCKKYITGELTMETNIIW